MDLSFLLEQSSILKSELDVMRPLDAETEARILQKLRLDWNYHSNHLEGGQLTYGETKALILFGITASGKPLQDHLETSGHDEAVNWIMDVVKEEYPITERFIRDLHKLVLKNPYEKEAITPNGEKVKRWIKIGEYKSTPNHVLTKTGDMFYFASVEETPSKMYDLLNWYNEKKANSTTNPIILAAEFHYRFICIHPFDDGNGRMARLLMNFILMQYTYPPAIIRTDDKLNYFSALRLADAGKLEPFINYIAENTIRTLEIMIKGAKGEKIDEPDDLDKELTLLEQKLKSSGDKVEVLRSKEVLDKFCEENLLLITNKFIEINDKFKRFYVKMDYDFHYVSEIGDYNEEYDTIFDSIIDFRSISFDSVNIKNIIKTAKLSFDILDKMSEEEYRKHFFQFQCEFNVFNRSNFQPFEYKSILSIFFSKTNYTLLVNSSGTKISKLYHQNLPEDELNYILDKEAKFHINFINEKTKKEEQGSDC